MSNNRNTAEQVIDQALADYHALTTGDDPVKYVTYDSEEEASKDQEILCELGFVCTPPMQVRVLNEAKTKVTTTWAVIAFRPEELDSPWSWQDDK